MELYELYNEIELGEDSCRQFKKNITNAEAMAAEMVAFSNGDGGKIFIGVNDDGTIAGLTEDDVRRINQLVSNVCSQHVQPSINATTKNILTDSGLVIIVDVAYGINKPYQDKAGVFWVKSGADKRRATSREEIQRLFQRAHLLHADEIPVDGVTINDFDLYYFENYFQKRFGELPNEENQQLPRLLENMGLMKDSLLTVCGALLFAQKPWHKLPAFIVKAGAFDAFDLSSNNYIDSRDIAGKLDHVYKETVNFIIAYLRHEQGNQDVNSIGIPEIPRETISELVANALIHRDYFTSTPVRVFVFRDRVEIISPGHLPNNLTVEKILLGASNTRNPSLASHANHIIPYRGYGSGITRAITAYPDIVFLDDRDANMFKVTIKRRKF